MEPAADGRFRTGILVNLPDNLSYASWAQQSRSFSAAMSDLYTTQAHPALMFSAFLALLGCVAGATGLPVQGWMNLFGLAGVGLTIVATYRLAREGGMDALAARASLGMLCFASGLSAVVAVLQRAGLDLPLGADARYLEAFGFTAFFGYPYQTFALGCLCATALALLRAEKAADAGDVGAARLLGLAALVLWLNQVHPYESLPLAGGYAAATALEAVRAHGRVVAARWKVWLVFFAAEALGLGYNLWVASQPVWADFAQASLSLRRDRAYWAIGYGLILAPALVGAWRLEREEATRRLAWAGWASVGLWVLLLAINTERTRIVNGAQLPVALAAGLGAAWWLERLRRTQGLRRVALGALTAAYGLLLVSTDVAALAGGFGSRTVDGPMYRAARHARDASATAGATAVVLCDFETAGLLPGLLGIRVFAGHWALTPDFAQRRDRLAQAGLDPEWSALTGVGARDGALRDVLRESGAGWVLVRRDAPGAAAVAASAELALAFEYGDWRLFERR